MRGEVEQSRVEADRVAVPLQHGAAQIVVQNDPRDAVPCSEGAEMTAQKILHAGVEEKAQKYVPREAEHHDEGHQGATGSTNHYVTKMTPVTLGLLPRQRAQAQIGLRLRAWPMAGDDGAEAAFAAAIAAFPNHRVQAAGGQRREPGQHLADERQIGVDLRWPLRRPDARQAGLGKHPGDGFRMHAQLPGDRSDAPLFNVVIAQDLRLEIRWNSHDRVLFVGSDGPGVAGSLAAHVPNSDGHNAGSTMLPAWRLSAVHAAIVARRPPPDPCPAQHSSIRE